MTTPASPPISLHDVAAELGISSTGLSLSDSRVRSLAGVPSGPISLHNLLGKSAYTPMSPNIGSGQGWEDGSDNHTFDVSVTPNGGEPTYSYQWYIVSPAGGIVEFVGSSTNATVAIGMIPNTPFVPCTCWLYCAVTDGVPNTVNSNEIGLEYVSP